jgi:hypothetical protein
VAEGAGAVAVKANFRRNDGKRAGLALGTNHECTSGDKHFKEDANKQFLGECPL